jgi:hypothetical protein
MDGPRPRCVVHELALDDEQQCVRCVSEQRRRERSSPWRFIVGGALLLLFVAASVVLYQCAHLEIRFSR